MIGVAATATALLVWLVVVLLLRMCDVGKVGGGAGHRSGTLKCRWQIKMLL